LTLDYFFALVYFLSCDHVQVRPAESVSTSDLDAEFLESQLRVTESEVNALHAQLVAREHKLQQQAEFARQAQARAAQLQLVLPSNQSPSIIGTGAEVATGGSSTTSGKASQVHGVGAGGGGVASALKSQHSPPVLTSVPARPSTAVPLASTSVAPPLSTSVARPQSSSAVSVSFASSKPTSHADGPASPMEQQRAQQLLKLQQHLHAGEERPITASSTTSTSSSTSSVSTLPHRPSSSDAARWQPTLSTVMSAPTLTSPLTSSANSHHAAAFSGVTRSTDPALVDGSEYNAETDEYDNDIEDDDGEDDNDEDDDLVFYPAAHSQRLHPPQSQPQPPPPPQPSHPLRERQEGQERPEEEDEDSELSDSEPLYPPYKPKYKYTPLQIESRYIIPTGFAWSKVEMKFPEPKLKKPTNVVKKKPLAKWEKKLVKRLVRVCGFFPLECPCHADSPQFLKLSSARACVCVCMCVCVCVCVCVCRHLCMSRYIRDLISHAFSFVSNFVRMLDFLSFAHAGFIPGQAERQQASPTRTDRRHWVFCVFVFVWIVAVRCCIHVLAFQLLLHF
jgi:hypothetical protein